MTFEQSLTLTISTAEAVTPAQQMEALLPVFEALGRTAAAPGITATLDIPPVNMDAPLDETLVTYCAVGPGDDPEPVLTRSNLLAIEARLEIPGRFGVAKRLWDGLVNGILLTARTGHTEPLASYLRTSPHPRYGDTQPSLDGVRVSTVHDLAADLATGKLNLWQAFARTAIFASMIPPTLNARSTGPSKT